VIGREGNYFGRVVQRFSVAEASGAETCYAAGTRLPLHRHAHPSLFLLLDGALQTYDRCGRWPLAAGMATILPPDEPHGGFVLSSARAINIELYSTHAAAMLPHLRGQAVCNIPVSSCLQSLHRELHARDEARQLAIEGLICQLLAQLLRQPGRVLRAPPAWLARAQELLADTLDGPLQTARLCGLLGVEARELIGAFRTHVGCSPAAFRRSLQMDLARRRLAETDQPLAQIAASAGFYDQAHFSRRFRQIHGYTPRRYRQLFGRGHSVEDTRGL
jgi:AraC family transcriptional regulator